MLNVSVGDVADGLKALGGASKAAEGAKSLSFLDGAGHTFANTGRDLGNLAKGTGGAVKSVWHSVFG